MIFSAFHLYKYMLKPYPQKKRHSPFKNIQIQEILEHIMQASVVKYISHQKYFKYQLQ